MKIKRPLVFVFSMYANFYLYDVNTKMIIGISRDLYDC